MVQNNVLTAEPQRTHFFVWRGDTAKQKPAVLEQQAFLVPLSVENTLVLFRGDEVSDPIAVSRSNQKKIFLSDLCGSAVNLDLDVVISNLKVQQNQSD